MVNKYEQVDQFKYLGCVISADGYCGTEIRRRSALSKQAFITKKKLFTGNLSTELKKRILYASETWTMTQENKKRLEWGPMPNVMAAQPNIGGILCESSVIPFLYHAAKFG